MDKVAVIYIDPVGADEFDYDLDELKVQKNLSKIKGNTHHYTLSNFIEAFNNGYISDEGLLINPNDVK